MSVVDRLHQGSLLHQTDISPRTTTLSRRQIQRQLVKHVSQPLHQRHLHNRVKRPTRDDARLRDDGLHLRLNAPHEATWQVLPRSKPGQSLTNPSDAIKNRLKRMRGDHQKSLPRQRRTPPATTPLVSPAGLHAPVLQSPKRRADTPKMTPPAPLPSSPALEATARNSDDLLKIVDSAIMYALRDYPNEDALRRRLEMINKIPTITLMGTGTPVHLPRPARALATLINQATTSADDWAWLRTTLASLGVDPTTLLIEAQAADPRRYREVAILLGSPTDYVLWKVADLPYMHSPKDCHNKPFHEEATRQLRNRRGPLRRKPTPSTPDVLAGRYLFERLQDGSLTPCAFHEDLDWDAVLTDSINIKNTVEPWTHDAITAALGITSDESSTPQQRFVRDLFLDPIRWNGTSPRVDNGQHRICRARLAGVEQIMIGHDRDEQAALARRQTATTLHTLGPR